MRIRCAHIAFMILVLASLNSRPAISQALIVSPEGSVSTIKSALDQARPGQKIVISEGVYYEHNLVIDQPVMIEGHPGAIIDGQGHPILFVNADSVTVQGITFRNVETSFVDDRAAIKADEARYCRIENNKFERTFFAVYLAKSAHCVVRENVIEGGHTSESRAGNGIHLWYSRFATIEKNHISGHRDGIYLEFVEDSELIENYSTENRRYGLHFMFSDRCNYRDNEIIKNDAGVAVMYSKEVEMTGNVFEGNWGTSAYGLLLKDITDSLIAGNVFEKNTIGIYAEGSDRLVVQANDFIENGWALKVMANCTDNLFSENNFLGNTFDVSTNSRQVYSIFEGNYWDRYEGYDLNKDGIGDVPFRPVRLFSLITEENEPAIVLLNSFFVDLLDTAERVLPALTPDALIDHAPVMTRNSVRKERS